MHGAERNVLAASLLSGAVLISGVLGSIASAQESIPPWQHAAKEQTDAMLHDPMIMYNAGGWMAKWP